MGRGRRCWGVGDDRGNWCWCRTVRDSLKDGHHWSSLMTSIPSIYFSWVFWDFSWASSHPQAGAADSVNERMGLTGCWKLRQRSDEDWQYQIQERSSHDASPVQLYSTELKPGIPAIPSSFPASVNLSNSDYNISRSSQNPQRRLLGPYTEASATDLVAYLPNKVGASEYNIRPNAKAPLGGHSLWDTFGSSLHYPSLRPSLQGLALPVLIAKLYSRSLKSNMKSEARNINHQEHAQYLPS